MKKKINKITLKCPTCKTLFKVWKYESGRGRKFCSKKCVRLTDKDKKNKSIAKLGNKNPMWKGNKAGLDAIHIWIRKRLPKPKKCQNCKIVPPLDLANISQNYKRILSDWEWLCRKCHMIKDGRLKKFLNK